MDVLRKIIDSGNRNFIFIGEAGSGKSEIAINFAMALCEQGDRNVHFFDMDMTKPLFRSRDVREELEAAGIVTHYQEQFMDAPTLVGGVRRLLRDPNSYVVMDVGGDYIGARSIGGFALDINRSASMVWYVINAYRPWSYDLEHIDQVLGEILGVSHIQIEKLHIVSNPNTGMETSAQEVVAGHQKTARIVSPYQAIEVLCAREALCEEVRNHEAIGIPVMPVHLYLTYPWLEQEESA